MQKEKALEKQKVQRAAALHSNNASTGRKDEPWLVTGIIVKVRPWGMPTVLM